MFSVTVVFAAMSTPTPPIMVTLLPWINTSEEDVASTPSEMPLAWATSWISLRWMVQRG